jgi:Holliday junction resolvase
VYIFILGRCNTEEQKGRERERPMYVKLRGGGWKSLRCPPVPRKKDIKCVKLIKGYDYYIPVAGGTVAL